MRAAGPGRATSTHGSACSRARRKVEATQKAEDAAEAYKRKLRSLKQLIGTFTNALESERQARVKALEEERTSSKRWAQC